MVDQVCKLTFLPWDRAGDKAILEAAYQENPKPDKIARLEIVKRVSLNEKEVQVSREGKSRRAYRSYHSMRAEKTKSCWVDLVSKPPPE